MGAQLGSSGKQSPHRLVGSPHMTSSWPSFLHLGFIQDREIGILLIIIEYNTTLLLHTHGPAIKRLSPEVNLYCNSSFRRQHSFKAYCNWIIVVLSIINYKQIKNNHTSPEGSEITAMLLDIVRQCWKVLQE